MDEIRIDNLLKAEDAMTIASILVQNGWVVRTAKYRPNPRTNAYRYYVEAKNG